MATPTPEQLRNAIKLRREKIPISKVLNLVYAPASVTHGSFCQALVASPEYTDQEEGDLVYVHSGSQHGILNLIKIEKEPMSGFPRIYEEGSYDRDSQTRLITAIYLPIDQVIPWAYFGKLEELLRNPNIKIA